MNANGPAAYQDGFSLVRIPAAAAIVAVMGALAVHFNPLGTSDIRGTVKPTLPLHWQGREWIVKGWRCVFPAESAGMEKSVAVHDLAGKKPYSTLTKEDGFHIDGMAGMGKGRKLFKIKVIPAAVSY